MSDSPVEPSEQQIPEPAELSKQQASEPAEPAEPAEASAQQASEPAEPSAQQEAPEPAEPKPTEPSEPVSKPVDASGPAAGSQTSYSGDRHLTTGSRSAMLHRHRGVFGWLGRRVFDHVKLDAQTANRVRALGDRGQLIYVMRTRSLLDYLFFNDLFLKIRMPLARFANGISLSFFRGLGEWFSDIFGRRQGPADADQLEAAIRAGDSALIFMKTRPSFSAERQASPGFFERIVAVQRDNKRPILLLPQLIIWPRKPPSRRRGWFDIIFGNQEASGKLRKLGHFIRHRKIAMVQMGQPIDLQEVLADHVGWSDARIARKIRRVLFIHLGHEAMAVRGPALKPHDQLNREILERRRTQNELTELATQMGISPAAAHQQARKHLSEIAAKYTFEMIQVFDQVLNLIFNRLFKGVEVDADGMRRVKEAAKLSRRAPLILVPCHKSHFDYLVISWVFYRNGFVPPFIAAGNNLSFFPLGWFLRRAGAFFLRRSFSGQPIYTLAFRRYLWKLSREGYPIEFFMEGGRSRTGKLLPPKLGMLSMLLDGARRGEYKDLQFVPINLSYERVVETAAYRRELTGGEKKTESMGGVMRASKVLRSRYGRVYVTFEEPVRLSEYLAGRGLELPEDETEFRALSHRLGYHLMRRIQEATSVAPSALVGAVLLSHNRRGMSGARLREMVGFLLDLLMRRGARLSKSIEHTLKQQQQYIETQAAIGAREGYKARGEALRPLIDEAMALLRKLVHPVQRGGGVIYTVPDRARIELDYYRNAILGILAPDAIVATALLAGEERQPMARLREEARKLSYWFRLEFIYKTDTSFDENFDEIVERLCAEKMIAIEGDRVIALAPLTLDFLRGTLLHLVEGYWIAADALRGFAAGPMERKPWLDHAREHGERQFLEGDIRRAEAASTAVLGNALELFSQEGLLEVTVRRSGRKTTKTYQLKQGVSVEEIAYRRDDLGMYLMGREEPRPSARAPKSNEATDPPQATDEPESPQDQS